MGHHGSSHYYVLDPYTSIHINRALCGMTSQIAEHASVNKMDGTYLAKQENTLPPDLTSASTAVSCVHKT